MMTFCIYIVLILVLFRRCYMMCSLDSLRRRRRRPHTPNTHILFVVVFCVGSKATVSQ